MPKQTITTPYSTQINKITYMYVFFQLAIVLTHGECEITANVLLQAINT